MRDVLILIGHGSHSKDADDVLPYYVDLFKSKGIYADVIACYLEKEPSVKGVLDRVNADRVFVMPLLIAHGYHTRVTIPGALGIKHSHDIINGVEVFYLEPIGRSGHIAELIQERIDALKIK